MKLVGSPQTVETVGGVDFEAERDRADLTPEWQDLLALIEADGLSRNGDKPEVNRYPDLLMYAFESSKAADLFTNYEFCEEMRTKDILGYVENLKKFIGSYYDLMAVHGAQGREASFRKFGRALKRYVVYHESQRSGGRRSQSYKPSYRRILASVLEELGSVSGEVGYYQEALEHNRGLLDDPLMPPHKPFTIHATFSQYDIAEALYGRTADLELLGISKIPKEQLGEFFENLEMLVGRITAVNKSDGIEETKLDVTVGALGEIMVLGAIRSYLLEHGLHVRYGTRQAFLHQDNRPRFSNSEGMYLAAPNATFDIAVFDRQTGKDVVKIDAKKGDKKDSRPNLMPNVIEIKLKQTDLDNPEFINLVGKYAEAKKLQYRGYMLSDEHKQVIEVVEARVDFKTAMQKYSQRLGREALSMVMLDQS